MAGFHLQAQDVTAPEAFKYERDFARMVVASSPHGVISLPDLARLLTPHVTRACVAEYVASDVLASEMARRHLQA